MAQLHPFVQIFMDTLAQERAREERAQERFTRDNMAGEEQKRRQEEIKLKREEFEQQSRIEDAKLQAALADRKEQQEIQRYNIRRGLAQDYASGLQKPTGYSPSVIANAGAMQPAAPTPGRDFTSAQGAMEGFGQTQLVPELAKFLTQRYMEGQGANQPDMLEGPLGVQVPISSVGTASEIGRAKAEMERPLLEARAVPTLEAAKIRAGAQTKVEEMRNERSKLDRESRERVAKESNAARIKAASMRASETKDPLDKPILDPETASRIGANIGDSYRQHLGKTPLVKMSTGDQAKWVGLKDIKSGIDDAVNLINTKPSVIEEVHAKGRIGGILTGAKGAFDGLSPEALEYAQIMARTFSKEAQAISGAALSAHELKRLEPWLINPKMSPTEVKVAIRRLATTVPRLMEDIEKAPSYKQSRQGGETSAANGAPAPDKTIGDKQFWKVGDGKYVDSWEEAKKLRGGK